MLWRARQSNNKITMMSINQGNLNYMVFPFPIDKELEISTNIYMNMDSNDNLIGCYQILIYIWEQRFGKDGNYVIN
jgi:hypothetical protein